LPGHRKACSSANRWLRLTAKTDEPRVFSPKLGSAFSPEWFPT
jgi:hypothetical protein